MSEDAVTSASTECPRCVTDPWLQQHFHITVLRDAWMDKNEEIKRLTAELAQANEWRNAVSGAIKASPWFESGEWGGDKEGWGYHLEMVGFLIRELAQARAEIERLESERTEYPFNVAVIARKERDNARAERDVALAVVEIAREYATEGSGLARAIAAFDNARQ